MSLPPLLLMLGWEEGGWEGTETAPHPRCNGTLNEYMPAPQNCLEASDRLPSLTELSGAGRALPTTQGLQLFPRGPWEGSQGRWGGSGD